MRAPITSGLTAAIRAYRYVISPMLGPTCRFYPSCSCYAEEALQQYGALRGSYLTMRRLMRCHPWHEGGYDPVPRPDTQINNTTHNTKPAPHG
jgi:putative membrane protein insertion efficiency factor